MIYLIKAEETNLYKIGYTAGSAEDRLNGMQTGCPHKLSIVKTVKGDVRQEKWLHKSFSNNKKRGEWFEFSDDEVEDVVDKMKNYRDANDIDIEQWRAYYDKHIRDSKSTDYSMEYFIQLAILEIMCNNYDTAIQRLVEFKELLFSRTRIIGIPELTDKILNTKNREGVL